MVELLIRSGVSSYLEFKTLEASFLFRDQSIQLVPCSRAEVFRSKSISLIEKRYLMKFMKPLIDSITAESAAATTPGADSAAGVEGDVPEVVVEEEEAGDAAVVEGARCAVFLFFFGPASEGDT
eukprot:TRINITY_DN3302_c0_g1_i3.p2 TRINITY_DN3302_c0_g1~~TRINITY_DN3302_c0_g1_i3.p2  ORF type:complete len:124 (-),score=37.57 TRINITY_DN3302_c0_g1_i3:279-650(-)